MCLRNHAASSSALVNYDQPSAGDQCDDETGSCGIYFAQGPAELTPWGPRPNMADPNVRNWIVRYGARQRLTFQYHSVHMLFVVTQLISLCDARSVRGLIDDFHVGSFRWDSTACIRQVGGKIGDGGCDTDYSDGWQLMQEANSMAHSAGQRGTLVVAEDTWGVPYSAITAALNDTSVTTPTGACVHSQTSSNSTTVAHDEGLYMCVV